MGRKDKTKEEAVIEKSEIEKIAEEIAKEQPVEEVVEVVETEKIAQEIAEEIMMAETETEDSAEDDTETDESSENVETESETEDSAEDDTETDESTENVETEPAKNKKKIWMIVGIATGVVVALLVAIYFAVAMLYSDKFLMGTTVNGIDCAGDTVEEVRSMLQKEVEEYTLTIETRDGATEVVKGTDIGIKYNDVDVIEEAMKKQNPYLWVKALFNKTSIKAKIDFEYDEKKLDEAVKQLAFMKPENQVAPVSAIPVYANGKYDIQSESYGTQIALDIIYETVRATVDNIEKTLNLEENNCYVQPVFKKDSQQVVEAKDALNKCLEANITYSLDGINVNVNKTMIANWISVDPATMTVNVNVDQVRAFANSLGEKYNTPNKVGSLTTPTGKVTEIPNAELGRVVGSAAECAQLINEIKAGKTITREPLLSQKPTQEGQVAWGATYIEVDITEQHMWYISNGAVAFECDIITGSPGRDTPVGQFTILEKLRNKVLRGNIMPNGKPEYETPVKYWARVTWSGIGFHDATWQPAFGGQMYKEGYGSHGCINMSLSDVAAFYEMIQVGCPVLIHY